MQPPRRILITLLAFAAAMAAVASVTRPFTLPGDAVVTVGLVAMVTVLALQRVGRAGDWLGRRRGSAAPAVSGSTSPWVIALIVVTAWELFCYAASPRRAHPTLSYLVDLVTVHAAGRGLLFAGWLWLGWFLVRA